jgi:hypothetical protein
MVRQVRTRIRQKVAAAQTASGRHLARRRMFIRIDGTIHYLWRAVDHSGQILQILVQTRRHRAAAQRFFRHLPEGDGYGSAYRYYGSPPQLLCRASSGPAQSQTHAHSIAQIHAHPLGEPSYSEMHRPCLPSALRTRHRLVWRYETAWRLLR